MENKSIKLTSEELYFLGNKMSAKYVDYAYIASLDLNQESLSQIEKNSLVSIEEKGFIEEDFSGDIVVNSEISSLLKPIFFGEKECEIDIVSKNDDVDVDVRKYHFYDGNIVEVLEAEDNQFNIHFIDELTFEKMLNNISNDYAEEMLAEENAIDFENVSIIITIKMANVEKSSTAIETLFVINDSMFAEDETGKIYFVSKNDFVKIAKTAMEV